MPTVATRKKRAPLNFWQKAEAFPPILCRLLAKHSGRYGRGLGAPFSNAELAAATGLSEYQISAIAWQTDWSGIDLPTMHRFTVACGIDFENKRHCKRAIQYLRGGTKRGIHLAPRWSYLRRHPDWETVFKPLCTRLQGSFNNKKNKV